MDNPRNFLNAINKLCIEMTYSKGKKDSKKKLKKIYRLMKKLLRKGALHGQRHQDIRWDKTNLTQKKAPDSGW